MKNKVKGISGQKKRGSEFYLFSKLNGGKNCRLFQDEAAVCVLIESILFELLRFAEVWFKEKKNNSAVETNERKIIGVYKKPL